MTRTIVSWGRFCEWVQGRTATSEKDVANRTVIMFADGSEAVVYSGFDQRFGETVIEPPQIEILEKSP